MQLVNTLREKFLYSEFSCQVFSRIQTEYGRYSLSLRIQPLCGKIWTRNIPNTDTFHAVPVSLVNRLRLKLSKSEFWDTVCLRYELPLSRLPCNCSCSKTHNVQHATSCKNRVFVTLRHNQLRDKIPEMLEKVTSDVKVKPALRRSGIFIVNLEHFPHLFLVFLSLL